MTWGLTPASAGMTASLTMSDLDVIREARDYLAGLIEQSEKFDPVPWAVEAGPEGSVIVGFTKGPITWDDHGGQVFEDPTAHLIVALRAAAPPLIEALDSAIAWQEDESMYSDEWPWVEHVNTAKAILATKGRDDE